MPLNGIVTDGSVVCARCGLEQAFDGAQWTAILEEAHATSDLWGDRGAAFGDSLSRDFVAIGHAQIGRAFQAPGPNEVHASASPGEPLCESCHAPLAVALDASAKPLLRTVTTCRCGATATYETPAVARQVGGVTSVIATEHRADRKHVKVEEGAAAIALRCPNCEAPLPIHDASKIVTCSYCHAQAMIPDRTWSRIGKKSLPPEPTWLLFHGPSRLRRTLLAEQRDAASEREREADEHARKLRKAQEQLARDMERERRERLEREEKDTAKKAADAKAAKKAGWAVVGVLVGSLVLATVAVLGYAATAGSSELATATTGCEQGSGKSCDDEGQLQTKDESAAARAFARACELHYDMGCLHSGAALEKEKSYGPALAAYASACEGDVPDACAKVDALAASPRVDAMTREAFYERRCAAGKLADCDAAGALYASGGAGLGRDPREAARLFNLACAGGLSAGCNLLADACKAGNTAACPAKKR